MKHDAAHTSLWQTSDAIFGSALIAGILLSISMPLPLSNHLSHIAYRVLGLGLVIAGSTILLLTKQQMNRVKQPTAPGQATTDLITSGIFAYSRNPMYLGLLLAFAGIGVLFQALWLLILLIPIVVMTHYVLIRPEEIYLQAKFGDAYESYRKMVRRWI